MTNKNRGDNASVDILHHDDSIIESLPFAVDETFSSTTSRDHNNNNHNDNIIERIPSEETNTWPPSYNKNKNLETSIYKSKMTTAYNSTISCNSQNSSPSTKTPGLVESMMTDATSCCSELSASNNAVDVVTKSTINNCQIKDENDSPQPQTTAATASSTAAMSSAIFSISSLQSVNLEVKESNKVLSRRNPFPSGNDSISMGVSSSSSSLVGEPRTIYQQQSEMSDSIGFSQLMQAADDSNIQLGQSRTTTATATAITPNLSGNRSNDNNNMQIHAHMPPLLEHQEMMESGALISAAPTNTITSICEEPVTLSTTKIRNWWPNILPSAGSSRTANHHELGTPLLTETNNTSNQINSASHVNRLLSGDYIQQHHANIALERARETVQIRIDDDESFEVSVLLGGSSPCTVDDVMDVISNADLLSLWCDPIETLIVISNSSDDSPMAVNVNSNANAARMSPDRTNPESVREYEGEWIEATTSVLESPSTSLSFIFNAGQRLLESLGFASYGRITMFVERRRGHVGLTIGPFHGGIHASHTIHVSEDTDSSGSIRIVDRVRLTRDEEVLPLISFVGYGVVGSCLSHCLLPSIVGYVDQVTTSMARLLLLLENNDILAGNSHPR
jgi:hypothetical protein